MSLAFPLSSRPLRAAMAAAFAAAALPAAGAGFVYQGELSDRGAPANGRYDLQVSAYADARTPVPAALPLTLDDVAVVDGKFSIAFELDAAAIDVAWLEVGVRDAGASAGYSAIAGRTPVRKAAAVGQCWSATGDAGTDPAVNFLGTTDAQPLVLRANNAPVARLASGSNTSTTAFGSSANLIDPQARGAAIGGGGSPVHGDPDFSEEGPNRVFGPYGTIAGGLGNTAGSNATTTHPSIGGGYDNAAAATGTTVGGGSSNFAAGSHATIAGGEVNTTGAPDATIGGGANNTAIGDSSVVAGGAFNTASGPASAVLGGVQHEASGLRSTVLGGEANKAAGARSIVLGGSSNVAYGNDAGVGNGAGNCAGGASSWVAGRGARSRPGTADSDPCEDGLASSGDADGDEGTFVWADAQNGFFSSTGPNQFLVRAQGGMGLNTADPRATLHVKFGTGAAVTPAGGTVILAQNEGSTFISTQAPAGAEAGLLFNRGATLADGGVLYNTAANPQGLTLRTAGNVDRMRITSSGATQNTTGAWTTFSDRRLKTDIRPLESPLERLLSLHGTTFRYRDPALAFATPGTRIGFIAQDVERVFPHWVSEDARGYKQVTPTGFEAVAVEAIRELRSESAAIDAGQSERIAALEAENAALHARLQALEARLEARR